MSCNSDQKENKIILAQYNRAVRTQFYPGEMVKIDSGYLSGIWLRTSPGQNIATDSANVRGGVLIVLEIDNMLLSKDPSIKVISEDGKVGWTFASRLEKM